MTTQQKKTLRAALGDYPHTMPLKNKQIVSERIDFDFAPIKPVYKAFGTMVREQTFDVSEMAIVTYLQAKAHGRPLVLLPAVMMGRFQHHCMLYDGTRGTITPANLAGHRVGARSYAQTTGVWLRGHLQNDYGADLDHVHWVTFEDAHVPEYRDPPGVERVSTDKNMTKMVLDGELDAAIYGAELPADQRLCSVIPDPEAAARKWHARHGVVPINHMVVVTVALAKAEPDIVREIYRMLLESKRRGGASISAGLDLHPFGVEACRPALQMIINYAVQQKLIHRAFEVEDLFDDASRALEA